MRKQLIFILFLFTAVIGHAAGDVVIDGVAYHYSNGEYIVTGWDETTPIQSLHIRGEIDDFPVTEIANNAFNSIEDIVYLKIDEGVTLIGENAFSRCTDIEVVVLPEGLEIIAEEAFAYCSALETIAIPSTVRDIQARAFIGCTSVTDVWINVTDVANFAWWDGRYGNFVEDYPNYEVHGGIEFNGSPLSFKYDVGGTIEEREDSVIHNGYTGEDLTLHHNLATGTMIHVPKGTRQSYVDSRKLEAWLTVEDDCYPLWWIVNYGVVDSVYTVCDDLTGVYVDKNSDLYAKDDNRYLMPDRTYPGEVDFMRSTGLLANRGNVYDQSNWVVLTGLDYPADYIGHFINGASITGTLRDKRNPVIEVSSTPVAGNAAEYIYNTYIAASVMTRTQTVDDGRTFAFVRPKPQELAYYEWTIYYENNEFYLPAPDDLHSINESGLVGGFVMKDDLYEQPPVPELETNGYYRFYAISRLMLNDDSNAIPGRRKERTYEPYVDGGLTDWCDIFPLNLPEKPIPTAIDNVEADSDNDLPLIYYDRLGRQSNNPFPGMNIIVKGRKATKSILP